MGGWVSQEAPSQQTEKFLTSRLVRSPEVGATTYHNPYTPQSTQDSIPPCPRPYNTYDGQEWMVSEQSDLWDY